MCGIAYYHNFRGQNVLPDLLKRYRQQRQRGTDGFGLYLPERNTLIHNTSERRMVKAMRQINASIALFHHRWPTSTDNIRNSCHPFSTKNFFKTNYLLVHNGVLQNERELKTEHEKLGIKYISVDERGRFNDSEALAWDVALYLEGKQKELKAKGSIAFVCYANSDNPKLYFGHNIGSPLVLRRNRNSINLASQGDGEEIATDRLYQYIYKTNQIHSRKLEIPTFQYVAATERSYQPNWKKWSREANNDDILVAIDSGSALTVATAYLRANGGYYAEALEDLTDDLTEIEEGYWKMPDTSAKLLDDAGNILVDMWDKNGSGRDARHLLYSGGYSES